MKRGATGFETFASTDYIKQFVPIEPATDGEAIGPVTNSLSSSGSASAFNLVQLNASGQWAIADANDETKGSGMLALTLETVGSSSAINVALPGCVVRSDAWAWATPGAKLYVSLTGGAITDDISTYATGNIVRIVGYAITDDCIYFNPSNDYLTLA